MKSTLEYDYLNETLSTVLVKHRFPWKASEIVGLSLFAALGAVLLIAVQPFVLGLAFLAVVPYLAYTNKSRKDKSALVLARTPIGLRMYKGKRVVSNPDGILPESVKDIVMTRDLDKNEFIVLRAEVTDERGITEEYGFRIPSRIYKTAGGKGFIESILASQNISPNEKVKTALSL